MAPEVPRPRRRLRKVALAFVVLLLVVLGAVAGALLYLRTEAGSELLRAQVESALNGALTGRLEIGRATVRGETVVLENLKLYTPEGELVATLRRLEATGDLPRLLSGTIALQDAKVDGLHAFFKRDERGLNLLRAVRARRPPQPPAEGKKQTDLVVDVESLALTDGLFEYQDSGRTVRLEQLAGKGHAKIHTGPFDIDSALEWRGVFKQPVEGPVLLRARASGKEKTFTAEAFVEGGGLLADARLSLATQELTVKAVEVNEALGRAVLGPAWPKGKVHLEGKASPTAAEARADLDGRTKVRATARYDAGAGRLDDAVVELEDVDLSQLKEGLVATRIGGKVTGRFADLKPGTLTGEAALDLRWATPSGARVGEAKGKLSARAGEATVEQLTASVPGARVEVRGTASEARLGLRGRLEASDAGQALRTVLEALGIEPVELQASGTLEVQVNGPVLDPSIQLAGRLPRVELGALRAQGLDVAGALPSVRRWREVDATLAAKQLFVGEGAFEDVRLGLATRGRDVTLDLSSKGLSAVQLHGAGRFEGREALALSVLALEWPGTTWTMEAPARLSWADTLDLEPVRLRSGTQALELEAHLKRGRLSARAGLAGLELARLPPALVPAKLGLAGEVSGSVVVEGPQKSPQVVAALEVKGGKVRTLERVELKVDGHLEQGRLKGALQASIPRGRAQGQFDFPLALGAAPPEAPLSLALQLEELAIEEVLAAAGAPPRVTGTVRLGATLQGTVGEPRLALDASTASAAVQRGEGQAEVQISSALVSVETRADGTPKVRADVTALGGSVKLDLTTPRKLSELLWRPPRGEAARALELEGDLSASGLTLAAARALLPPALVGFQGTVELTAHAAGTVGQPTLDGRLLVAGLSSEEFKPIDVGLEVSGGPAAVKAKLAASHAGEALGAVEAESSVSLAQLLQNAVQGSERLEVKGRVGPLNLTQVAALRGDDGSPVTGKVRAALSAGGTLDAPELSLDADLESLKLRKTALGKALVEWRYARGKSAVKVGAVSTNGGQLQARGELDLPLGLSALKAGLSPLEAPVRAQLASRGFDLSFLSGAHAALRTVGGYVTADAQLSGKLGAPTLEGLVAWNKGRLHISGISEFRDIELKVVGSNEEVELEKLTARSGAGSLQLTGSAKHQGRSLWAFSGALETERLPVVADDQLRFILDVRSTLEGELSPLLWNVRRLSVPRAEVTLPVLRKKDTQALDRPKDIVLVRDGVAVGPRPRRWKKKAEEALAGAVKQVKGRVMRVTLDAGQNLWVRGNDVNLEVGLSDGFTVEFDQQLYLNGTVTVKRGKVSVIGRDFEVKPDSSVTFSGPPGVPALNVTAAYTNHREKVTVYATLVGSGEDFTFRTSSQPALSESEIYALLATGRKQLRRGSGSAISGEQSLSVLGAVVAAQLKTALSEKLPVQIFDVLEISAGSDGFRGTRLEAGKYLSDRLYLGYVGQLGADPRKGENSNAGRIEYQFAPGWSVQATAGDAPAGSAELVWGIEF